MMLNRRIIREMLAIAARYAYERETLPLVTRSEALSMIEDPEKVTSLFDVASYVSRVISEEAYVITSSGLVRLGKGCAIEVPGWLLPRARGRGLFHVHPLPPIFPSIEDLEGAAYRGTCIECVGGVVNGYATVVCIKPLSSWIDVAEAVKEVSHEVFSRTSFFVPVAYGGDVVFVPAPTPSEAEVLERKLLRAAATCGFVEVYKAPLEEVSSCSEGVEDSARSSIEKGVAVAGEERFCIECS